MAITVRADAGQAAHFPSFWTSFLTTLNAPAARPTPAAQEDVSGSLCLRLQIWNTLAVQLAQLCEDSMADAVNGQASVMGRHVQAWRECIRGFLLSPLEILGSNPASKDMQPVSARFQHSARHSDIVRGRAKGSARLIMSWRCMCIMNRVFVTDHLIVGLYDHDRDALHLQGTPATMQVTQPLHSQRMPLTGVEHHSACVACRLV